MSSSIDTHAALKYFKQHDPIMHALLNDGLKSEALRRRIPVAKPPTEYFASIVHSIIGQQISTKAAAAVRTRVTEHLGHITPETVQEADFDTLKACGLSNQKTKYLKHNAEVWHEIPCGNFVHLADQEIITTLTTLYGIGTWTAEMFLLFSMARPNIFSYGDLALMQSLYHHYSYHPHYKRKIATTVNTWSPHRTLASLTLWHCKDNGPVTLQNYLNIV